MLSPVGLALVSRAAPHKLAGLLMGVWLLSSGVANYYAGNLENILKGSGIPPYLFLIGSSIGMGVLLLADLADPQPHAGRGAIPAKTPIPVISTVA